MIPPKANADFVCQMEEVLDVYHRPYDPMKPLICFDELSKQLVREVEAPLPVKPGEIEKYDYHYERNGVANIFMVCEPIRGKRWTKVTKQRTKIDWAGFMKEIADIHYPSVDKIVVVMDNLNTHKASSFYEAFSPEEAQRLINRFEFHYTPKHGSWLNMAEIELSVLSKQCLNRRIPDLKTLKQEVSSWEKIRNGKEDKIIWRFTTKEARIKLRKLYPTIQI